MKRNIFFLLTLIGFQTAFSQVEQDTLSNSVDEDTLDEIVISGTMKPVSRSQSLVPVEVYTPTFFKKNPTSNVFEALQIVNGVRPQVNCSVCNTGDIHINGLEGPYTFVLIDGMPIVSGLSTVYGLSGIPNSLIERVEVVKGPASSLYGSEAVGGLINIITKNPKNASLFSADVFGTSWGEVNTDVGLSTKVGEKSHLLMGVNYFNYSNPIDKNNDNFTDLTLQDRISVFQKWNFTRKSNKLFSIAGRYFYEDRWGGEMNWNKKYRGGDEVYGESIYTNRYELMGTYELPVAEKMFFSFSYANHDQNSVYGNTPYMAKQQVGFGQLTWDKKLGKHDMLFGAAFRYTSYDDNTPATNEKDVTTMPGFFAQDEISFNTKHSILLGARYDYNNNHGSIFTPRVAYRYKANTGDVIRLNAGTGFRVVNLFTEDHAALSGSRDVIVFEDLKPEKSYNVNLSYLKQWYFGSNVLQLEASTWYTYFTNAILPDYDTNPNQIIYDNLNGHATSKGISANVDLILGNGLKFIVGATLMDVSTEEEGVKQRQMLTERFSGTWAISYTIPSINLDIDYTGNLYGPMRLPLVSEWDPRPEYSETYSIQNIQLTYKGFKNFQVYGGVKNLLNWTPSKNVPFLISRSNDPFDKNVQFDPNGNAMRTPDNPYGLVFDPSYVYAANQGIRTFLGVRYNF
ncbi:TonB-dependent receptor [Flavobacterium dauae]|uniref:TonB-dependent receptor plug domain-containing protein n=1 Tax=Flavobacterium dauae TaxID=1563479 RepID=UPI00101B4E62|nr:TonB-dependent receptor [Flavobacterium dauae]WLD23892.1 TonB-dependent receptor [Flavobacterium dauae]